MTSFLRILCTLALLALALPPSFGCDNSDGGEPKARDDHDGHDHAGGGSHDDHDDHAEHTDEVTLTAEAIRRWGVRVERAGRHALIETQTFPARVAFDAESIAHVGSLVSGRVSEVRVRIGQTVEAGEAVLVIQSPSWGEAQGEYLRLRRLVSPAESSVAVARELYERGKALHESSGGIALSEVQRREAELRAAEASLVAARSSLEAAENALRLLGKDESAIAALAASGKVDAGYVIRSPIAGQVVEREVTLGEAVGPERDALLVVADMSELWVIADVSEARVSTVRVGTKTKVTPAGGRAIEGTVTYIGPQADPSTRTVPVRIAVPGEGGLRPGMFVRAEVTLGEGDAPRLAVPASAVQMIEGWPSVFVPVEGEANTFAKRVVRVGPRVGELRPILEGLSEGEAYVAGGAFILKADLGKASAEHVH